MKLIVGLGNPGEKYSATRHNVGFWVIEALSIGFKIPLSKKNFKSLVGLGRLNDEQVIFAKPLTYMNLSGHAVYALMEGFACSPADLIVIHDDIDLNLGKIKIKMKGGDAGHKGIRSIIEKIETGEFTRIRIGIGRPQKNEDVVDYVLNPFSSEEMSIIKESVEKAVGITEQLVSKK